LVRVIASLVAWFAVGTGDSQVSKLPQFSGELFVAFQEGPKQFSPREDITPHELAKVMQLLLAALAQIRVMDRPVFAGLPETTRRHFAPMACDVLRALIVAVPKMAYDCAKWDIAIDTLL
jgi:hypothetical protein